MITFYFTRSVSWYVRPSRGKTHVECMKRMKVVDLSERSEKKGIIGTLLVGIQDARELVVDVEVNRQML
jgi:hypothetical protein